MFFGSSKKVIGIDIGTSAIKIADINLTRSGAELLSFGMIPTPNNTVSSGEILDIGAVGLTVQILANDLKVKAKNASTGMWGTAVIVKKITIPRMDSKLLREQIKFEAEQYIPFDLNNISLAYNILQHGGNQDTMEVLLIAAQNELVMQYSQVTATAGLNCSVLDVSSFALANCFELNYGRYPGESIGVFNFGSSITNFAVINNMEVIFSRDIPIGGSNHTTEIHKTLGVTIDEAESLKLGAATNRDLPEDIRNVLNTTNEMIADEIRNSLEFLAATTNGLTLSRCFYTGGSSSTPGMVDVISRVNNLHFEKMNPFKKVKFNSRKHSEKFIEQIKPFSAIALGLAMREIGDA